MDVTIYLTTTQLYDNIIFLCHNIDAQCNSIASEDVIYDADAWIINIRSYSRMVSNIMKKAKKFIHCITSNDHTLPLQNGIDIHRKIVNRMAKALYAMTTPICRLQNLKHIGTNLHTRLETNNALDLYENIYFTLKETDSILIKELRKCTIIQPIGDPFVE
jgi:hypothetical protein